MERPMRVRGTRNVIMQGEQGGGWWDYLLVQKQTFATSLVQRRCCGSAHTAHPGKGGAAVLISLPFFASPPGSSLSCLPVFVFDALGKQYIIRLH